MGVGRFTLEKLTAALADVCAVAGLDHRGAELLRFTNNAVFQLADQPFVVRIVASRALEHRVEKVVRVAEWFAEHDVPAVRLMDGLEHPVKVDGYVATVWDTAVSTGDRPDGTDLAALLRVVHRLPQPPEDLPGWAPLDDVRKRLGEAEVLAAADREFLLERCAEVEAKLDELEFVLPPALVHGDAHLGNVIRTADGPVLCDFDSSCLGPPEWDLTPVAVGLVRFAEPADTYRDLVAGYGLDVTEWAGFPVLREVRELKLTTSVLPIVSSHPEVRPELERRLADLRGGDTSARWARYT